MHKASPFSAKQSNCNATIVMPITTPQIKIDAVQRHGATVILHGDTYDLASDHAKKLAKQQQLNFIHPFDDLHVIAPSHNSSRST